LSLMVRLRLPLCDRSVYKVYCIDEVFH
jgi:hypothetical protein